MAINMNIDLTDATFADLVALVDAANAAGVDRGAPLELDGSQLAISVDPAARSENSDHPRPAGRAGADAAHRPLPQLGDAAIRSVVDILTGRQEPPRR